MKLAVRILAVTVVVAGAIAGNSMQRNTLVASAGHSVVAGRMPTCNPFTQKCANIR